MNTLSEYNKFTILGPPMRSYTDNYEFPWLRFGVDAPTKGNDYLLQADYKISRVIKMYVRFKSETKEEELPESSAISGNIKDNFRFHINYKEGENWSFANRFETSLIDFDK